MTVTATASVTTDVDTAPPISSATNRWEAQQSPLHTKKRAASTTDKNLGSAGGKKPKSDKL
jgi:hypothetical protein